MFGRFVGHYEWADVVFALSTQRGAADALCAAIRAPQRHVRLFSRGREALHTAMLEWKRVHGGGLVATPAWGCPIVIAAIEKAGHTPLLIDVSPQTLRVDARQILDQHIKTPLVGALLVAENGAPWNDDAVAPLRDAGVPILLDYALAWGAALDADMPDADFHIFSGGFSKPISGLGLGVLVSRAPVDVPVCAPAPRTWTKSILVFAHLLLQSPSLYGLLRPLVPKDLEAEYDSQSRAPADASCAVVLRSLERWRRRREAHQALLSEMRDMLSRAGCDSPLIDAPDAPLVKVLLEERAVTARRSREIEYHRQYTYDLRRDSRVKLIDSDYEGVRAIRDRYVSIAINPSVIARRDKFLAALRRDLHVD